MYTVIIFTHDGEQARSFGPYSAEEADRAVELVRKNGGLADAILIDSGDEE